MLLFRFTVAYLNAAERTAARTQESSEEACYRGMPRPAPALFEASSL